MFVDEPNDSATAERDIYTVSRLNHDVREILEGSFPTIWLEGEISNLARPRSGHMYFSLKDDECQVRCAMFRSRNQGLRFEPSDGSHVLMRAQVGLYVARGEFQLIVESMQEAGEGALRRAYEALKLRLAAEGLFDETHKLPLPRWPARLGVITSATGAALRDILTVVRRRFPALDVLIYPVPVQGDAAAPAIARALATASERRDCDVLILARGGGSLEDLWAFNEEVVARALHACTLPVVAGVGHQTDFTIADLAADHRAPTPSAAAELVTPDQLELRQRIADLRARHLRVMRGLLREHRQATMSLGKRLRHPRRRLQDASQRLDGLTLRLTRAMVALPGQKRAGLAALRARLYRHDPSIALRAYQVRWDQLSQRMRHAGRYLVSARRKQLDTLQRTLQAVSPFQTLERGYAIVTRVPEGDVVRSADEVANGGRVEAKLASGSLVCTVDESKPV